MRNSSTVECTLQGEVPTTMLAGGREIPMLYTHGIDEEGRTRVVAVPAGGNASLRLDWSGPFCQPVKGALELAIELPHDGGRLRAPVTADERPGCPQGEGVHPRARGTLSRERVHRAGDGVEAPAPRRSKRSPSLFRGRRPPSPGRGSPSG